MKKGILIGNGSLKTPKFLELYSLLIAAAARQDVALSLVYNTEISLPCGDVTKGESERRIENADFVLFWDKDIFLARAIERLGVPLFNCSKGIALCDDKRLTTEKLSAAGLPMPKSFFAPLTFGGGDLSGFLAEITRSLSFPCVVKEAFGSFGAQVYLAENFAELAALCEKLKAKPFLVSEFIKKSCGRDLRLQVVAGEVVAAMERVSENGDFRAGLTSGGSMRNYVAGAREKSLAVRACNELSLTFGGVDLLFTEDDFCICEVNSNAHFKNLTDLTGADIAGAIIAAVTGGAR